jgi:uroporphyrin-III C-methyltransferase
MLCTVLILLALVSLHLSCGFVFKSSYRHTNKHKFTSSHLHMGLSNNNHPTSGGKLSLVGAGPGDPDLLTVQALRLLKEADVVVADRLVSSEILALVDTNTDNKKQRLLVANKKPGCAESAQEEIYQWVCDAVRGGENVVRLKIGDPLLFGRGGEEILRFRQELQLEPFVSAGISSALSAPLAANIPLTHRGVSSRVHISTGYGHDGKRVSIPPYEEERTIVLLMAVGRIGALAQEMMSSGYGGDTPVAIIENATTSKQRTIVGTLRDIEEIAARDKARAPACIVIGDVVNVLC